MTDKTPIVKQIDKLGHLRSLIDDCERELVNCAVQHWLYTQEYAKPDKMGKERATENMGIYEARMKALEQNLDAYRRYAKEKLGVDL